MPKTVGQLLAAALPVRDDEANSDLISLVDIVITGIEAVPWCHFKVIDYNHEASGEEPEHASWGTIIGLEAAYTQEQLDSGLEPGSVVLWEGTVREAVAAYVDSRIDAGMGFEEAQRLVDGSYTDAAVADSILQFLLYREVVFN